MSALKRAPIFPLLGLLLSLSLLFAMGCGGPDPDSAHQQSAAQKTETTKKLQGAARGWNVLFLTIDTLRADRLNSYGYTERTTSPELDALFASGVRFDQAIAPRALTWPALATVLTGSYPSGHGVIQNGYDLPDDLETLPKALDEAGYETAAILGNMCKANHQGWDSFQCTQGRDGRGIQWTRDWAEKRAQRQNAPPFFLWVHLFGAHSPYYNGGDLAATELDPTYQGDLVPKKWRLDAIMKEKEQLTTADIRHLNAIYDAAVIGSDRIAGRILAALKEAGLLENTLIVLLADHGEDLYQHNGYLYHACSVYQSSLHVPLGIAAPGLIDGGGTVLQTVELSDVAPTVLDLLGLAPLPAAQGSSLRSYLERPERSGAGKPAFSEYGDTRIRTVQAGPWKLVHNPEKLTPICFAGPEDLYPIAEVELFDLSKDPLEQSNLAEAEPTRAADLKGFLRKRFMGLKTRTEKQELSEELKQELRSLGYVAP